MITKFNAKNLPTVTTVYKVERKTVWSIAEKENLLLFITGGECSIESNGEIHNLKKGDLMFLPMGAQYERKPLNENSYSLYYLHFYFDGEEISTANAQKELISKLSKPNSLDFFAYLTTVVNAYEYYEIVEKTLDRMNEIRLAEEVNSDLQLALSTNYLLSIMAELSQKQIISGLKVEKLETFPAPLKDAVFYIKQHLNEKITLDDLCKVALVSPQQLIRYFKKYIGKTPNAYITTYKVNVARDYIMRSAELSIKTIAYELGFDDQCYFSRVFSKTTGESPTDYYLRVKNFDKNNAKT